MSPAVGYRIDYAGRSVVISGDSNASAALFTLAEGADLLFHDALSRTLLDPMIAGAKAAGLVPMPKIMTDVIDYHADTRSLLAPTKAARVKQLVLYHLVPVPTNGLAERLFRRDLGGGDPRPGPSALRPSPRHAGHTDSCTLGPGCAQGS